MSRVGRQDEQKGVALKKQHHQRQQPAMQSTGVTVDRLLLRQPREQRGRRSEQQELGLFFLKGL